jgi:hypothetical protein
VENASRGIQRCVAEIANSLFVPRSVRRQLVFPVVTFILSPVTRRSPMSTFDRKTFVKKSDDLTIYQDSHDFSTANWKECFPKAARRSSSAIFSVKILVCSFSILFFLYSFEIIQLTARGQGAVSFTSFLSLGFLLISLLLSSHCIHRVRHPGVHVGHCAFRHALSRTDLRLPRCSYLATTTLFSASARSMIASFVRFSGAGDDSGFLRSIV